MKKLLIFLSGLAIGGSVGYFWGEQQTGEEPREDFLEEATEVEKEEQEKGSLGIVGKQVAKKQKNKGEILEYLQAHKKITNNQVEDLLGVSDATATRYLRELQKEGKIRKVGKTGRSVYYQQVV